MFLIKRAEFLLEAMCDNPDLIDLARAMRCDLGIRVGGSVNPTRASLVCKRRRLFLGFIPCDRVEAVLASIEISEHMGLARVKDGPWADILVQSLAVAKDLTVTRASR